jgi:SlyX protein
MDAERFTELEIKVAFQDKVIADLEALVRSFGVRVDELARELKQLKDAVRSPEVPMGPANEPPPHY